MIQKKELVKCFKKVHVIDKKKSKIKTKHKKNKKLKKKTKQ